MTKSSIDHYLEEKPYFVKNQTSISVADLPVVTICFENDAHYFRPNKCQPQLNEPIQISWKIETNEWEWGNKTKIW